VERAKGLFACVSQDAENVYITLSSRQFNPNLTIIARADRPESVTKLERAGANRVLTPHQIGGKRIAQVMLRPTVTDFMDLATQGHNLQMEEIAVRPGSEMVGKNLITSGIRPRFIPIGKTAHGLQSGKIFRRTDGDKRIPRLDGHFRMRVEGHPAELFSGAPFRRFRASAQPGGGHRVLGHGQRAG